jgi:peptidoglycan/LPS O-acetylase OafA/YrhL
MQRQLVAQQTSGEVCATVRLHYLDWLRVFSILGVFLFHASNVFNDSDFHIKNAERSTAITVIQGFVFPWGMPLFFLIAGTASWFALCRRTDRQYVRERYRRLLIPFLFGCLLFTPFQLYFEWNHKVQTGDVQGSLQEFLATLPWGATPRIFDVLGYHLWFLALLFCFSLLTLPLLRWLNARRICHIDRPVRVDHQAHQAPPRCVWHEDQGCSSSARALERSRNEFRHTGNGRSIRGDGGAGRH